VFLREVDPELQSEGILLPGAMDWKLCVHDSSACDHPLDISWPEKSSVPLDVFVLELWQGKKCKGGKVESR
jgi:hypothetical protein